MRNKNRLNAEGTHKVEHFLQCRALALQPSERVLDTSRLRPLALVQEVLTAAADAMHLFGQIHHLKPSGKSANQVACRCRRATPHPCAKV